MDDNINIKEELKTILRYYDKRLDDCTMEEMKAFYRMMVNNMEIDGTLDDFAEFYGKSKDAVSSVIKRRMFQKPKRNVVLYPFHIFRTLVPRSWHRKN